MLRKGLTRTAFSCFIVIDESRDTHPHPRQARCRPPLHHRDPAWLPRGKGHLVWVLTVSYPGGRNKQISLSKEQKPLVQQWLRNYQKLKATLERVCELNHKLLRPESHR